MELTDRSKLSPMYTYADAVNTPSATDLQAHTGLMVYNTNQCIMDGNGLYIWNSIEWIRYGDRLATSVYEVIDTRDNNVYLARNFGTAGDWMLENMRYIDPSLLFSIPNDTQDPNVYTLRRYFYPQVNTGKQTNPANISTWRKAQGLLYSYAAATQGQWDGNGVDNGNNSQERVTNKTKGICPDGWHVPTDYEWSLLEEQLALYPAKYSTVALATQWIGDTSSGVSIGTNDYYSFNGIRPKGTVGHAIAMSSPCLLPGASSSMSIIGKSFTSEQGGFDLLATGTAKNGIASGYGITGMAWTASSSSPDTPGGATGSSAWIRYTIPKQGGVMRSRTTRENLLSVRCKKD